MGLIALENSGKAGEETTPRPLEMGGLGRDETPLRFETFAAGPREMGTG